MCFITVGTRTIVTTAIIMIVVLIKINDWPWFCIKAIWKDRAEQQMKTEDGSQSSDLT